MVCSPLSGGASRAHLSSSSSILLLPRLSTPSRPLSTLRLVLDRLTLRPLPVIGALIGIQKGREVEIVNSYELALERPPSAMDVEGEDRPVGGGGFEGEKVDWAFFEERSGNCESPTSSLECLRELLAPETACVGGGDGPGGQTS